jgi:hypothetical protein
VRQLEELDKDWISLLKRNRKLLVSSFEIKDAQGQPIELSGETIKVEDLVPLIPACAYRKISHQERDYWCFTLCVRIEGLGKVRLVISFDNPQLSGTYAVLVSNRTDWSAKEILVRYLRRWTIETFYRDGKQQLGLEAYRMRSLESIKAHWTLVFVAYSLLHLTCLPPPSLKGRAVLPSAPQQSIGAACRQQGQAFVESLILFAHDLLEQGKSAAVVFERLFAKQKPILPHG